MISARSAALAWLKKKKKKERKKNNPVFHALASFFCFCCIWLALFFAACVMRPLRSTNHIYTALEVCSPDYPLLLDAVTIVQLCLEVFQLPSDFNIHNVSWTVPFPIAYSVTKELKLRPRFAALQTFSFSVIVSTMRLCYSPSLVT